jgi:pimeloyl-ACP methyl ester carboxylesterase
MTNVVEQTSTNQQRIASAGYHSPRELVPAHWTEQTIRANGIQQHFYRTGGTRPPLVCLHGFGESGLCWLRVARRLEATYDIIMVDARGHGGSSGVTSGFSPEILAEDVRSLLHALRLEHVCLLGASMGGSTAAQVAATAPDLIQAIVLEDPPWDLSAQLPLVASKQYQARVKRWHAWLQHLQTQTPAERLISALERVPPGAATWTEEEYLIWVESWAQLDLDLLAVGPPLWSRLEVRLGDLLPHTSCQILLMRSAYAFATSDHARQVQEDVLACPDIVVADFAYAGHSIHREAFEEFIIVVRAFLRECRRRPT